MIGGDGDFGKIGKVEASAAVGTRIIGSNQPITLGDSTSAERATRTVRSRPSSALAERTFGVIRRALAALYDAHLARFAPVLERTRRHPSSAILPRLAAAEFACAETLSLQIRSGVFRFALPPQMYHQPPNPLSWW